MTEEWTEIEEKLKKLSKKHQAAVWSLAQGHSQQRTGNTIGVSQQRIGQLIHHDLAFREALDSLSEYVGLADRAARLRMAQRAALQFEDPETGQLETDRDLLDWLKYIGKLLDEDQLSLRVEQVRYVEPKSMADLMAGLD